MTDFLKIAKSIAVHFAHICAYGVETVKVDQKDYIHSCWAKVRNKCPSRMALKKYVPCVCLHNIWYLH